MRRLWLGVVSLAILLFLQPPAAVAAQSGFAKMSTIRMAGASTSRSGMLPWRSSRSHQPATAPGTVTVCAVNVGMRSYPSPFRASIEAAAGAQEVMIIGGGSIYELALPLAERLYLTHIEHGYEGDAWFPEFDQAQWRVIASETHAADQKNPCAYRFVTYERKNKKKSKKHNEKRRKERKFFLWRWLGF